MTWYCSSCCRGGLERNEGTVWGASGTVIVPLFTVDEPVNVDQPGNTTDYPVGTRNRLSQAQVGSYRADAKNYADASAIAHKEASASSHAPHSVHGSASNPK